MEKIFTIGKNETGTRLDKFLKDKFPDMSRGSLQKFIQSGFISVNGKPTPKTSYLLKTDDKIIVLEFPQSPELSNQPDASISLNIVYENNDIIVIDKPAGLVVHPSDSTPKGTLVNALMAKYPEIKNVGEDPLRPGIVHRLDKDTSGLIVAAKNNPAFQFLKNQFQNRDAAKKYIALVSGKIKEQRGIISASIGRFKTKQIIVDSAKKGQEIKKSRPAITEYEVIKYINNYTLVSAMPKTGRMHQLRVHFAYIGHPIIGDQKYGHKKERGLLNRQFLHASELTLKLPDGKIKTFTSELPKDLKEFLSSDILLKSK